MSKFKFYIEEEKPLEEVPKIKLPKGKVKFDSPRSLNLKSLQKREYRVHIEFLETNTSIDYEMETQSRGIVRNIANFRFKKKNFYINQKQPDRIIDELSILVNQYIYPIELVIDYHKQKQQIINIEEIKKRWFLNKPTIEQEYGGYLINNYIAQIEKKLGSFRLFTQALLNNDLFFNLYTHSVYTNYPLTQKIEKQFAINVGDYNHPLLFNGKQWVSEEYNKVGGVFVYYQGFAEKKGILYEIKVEYNLHWKTFSIKDIRAQIKKVQDNIFILSIEIWQLRNREPQIDYFKLEKEEERKREEDEKNIRHTLKIKEKIGLKNY